MYGSNDYNYRYPSIGVLKGKVLKHISVNRDLDVITFNTEDDESFEMYHSQDCCESVYIESIVGDVQDLIGQPLILCEEVVNCPEADYSGYDSVTFTFYKFATIKGYVDIRWVGESNGYYSEGVDFKRVV